MLRLHPRGGSGSYLLLAISADQDDEHQQEDDAHAHDEHGEVGHEGHDEEQRLHLGCGVVVNSRRLGTRKTSATVWSTRVGLRKETGSSPH